MKANRTRTQKEMILDHMKRGLEITDLEALNLYGCRRLAARKWDLVQDGHEIKTAHKKLPSGATIAVYYMVSTPTQTRLTI